MAESGMFRTGLRGFKKEDVLLYIDRLQREDWDQLSAAQGECARVKQELEIQKTACSDASSQALESEEKLRDMQERLEKMTVLAKTYKQELLHLRDSVAALEQQAARLEQEAAPNREQMQSLQAELSDLREQNRSLREELTAATQENERYAKSVGDVGALMVEARELKQTLALGAEKAGKACFEKVEAAVCALEQCAKECRASFTQTRKDWEITVAQSSDPASDDAAGRHFFRGSAE